ncbi:MAG TPA: hypothetical protein VF950_27665 [Planctomycetota bacterium]
MMPRRILTILGLALCSGFASSQAAPDDASVWVEGESAGAKQVKTHPWYSDAVRKDQMSGEAWLSHFSDAADGTARYDLKIEKDGDYTLWVRANPVGSALAYQLNGGAWAPIDTSKASDVVNIAQDDKADLRFLGWMNGGKIPLKKGSATLAFKMHSPAHHHGAIDCFVLTTRAFEPRGTLKPGETQPPPAVPVLTDETVRKWIDFIRPSTDDTKWERLGWREELDAAVREARTLQRPLLLWAMNGHPLACT